MQNEIYNIDGTAYTAGAPLADAEYAAEALAARGYTRLQDVARRIERMNRSTALWSSTVYATKIARQFRYADDSTLFARLLGDGRIVYYVDISAC